MDRSIILWTLFNVLAVSSRAQIAPKWQDSLIAGLKIVRVACTETTVTDEEGGLDIIKYSHTYFDSLGRPVKTINNNCENCGSVREYDSRSGKLNYVQMLENGVIQEWSYDYDEKGRVLWSDYCLGRNCSSYEYVFEADSLQRIYTFDSEESRRLSTSSNKTPEQNDKLFKKLSSVSRYLPSGRMDQTTYFKKGQLDKTMSYEYDNWGNVVKIWMQKNGQTFLSDDINYDSANQLSFWKQYTYADKNGNLSQSSSLAHYYEYFPNGLLRKKVVGRTTSTYEYHTE